MTLQIIILISSFHLTLLYLGGQFCPTLRFLGKTLLIIFDWLEISRQFQNMLGEVFYRLGGWGVVGGIDNFWHAPMKIVLICAHKLGFCDRNS